MSPITGKHTAVIRKPNIPKAVKFPDSTPTCSGYIKFPAPNSIENIAKPVATMCSIRIVFMYIPVDKRVLKIKKSRSLTHTHNIG